MSFYLTHLCSGRTDTGDGLFYTSRFSQTGDKATDGLKKMNIAARWFQCRMMPSVPECSLKSVSPYGIKFGNLQKESADANEATILCLAMLGEKPENEAPLFKLAHLPIVRKFIRLKGPTVPIIRQRKRLNFTIGEHVTILEYQDVFAKVTYRVPDIFSWGSGDWPFNSISEWKRHPKGHQVIFFFFHTVTITWNLLMMLGHTKVSRIFQEIGLQGVCKFMDLIGLQTEILLSSENCQRRWEVFWN